MEYRVAEEIKTVAGKIIGEHHHLLERDGPRIEYLATRSKNPGTGRDFRIRKITGVNAFLAGDMPDRWRTVAADELVVVEVKEFYWHNELTRPEQRFGLVDHLLHHLRFDEDNNGWTIEPPEYGEFPTVLKRHGFWRPGDRLQRFIQLAHEQLQFDISAFDESEVDRDTGEVLQESMT